MELNFAIIIIHVPCTLTKTLRNHFGKIMAESEYSPSQSPPPSGATTDARMNRDSIKKGFNDIMKFADVNFSRAKQVRVL